MEKVKIAVIGLGRISRVHLPNLLHRIEEAEVVAVCDCREEALGQVTQEYGLRGYLSFSGLLEKETIDAVVITTPPASHLEIIETALEAGVHIFCEKPVALDLKRAEHLASAAEGSEVKFQLGFQRRFDHDYAEAKRKIEAGLIGRPVTFRATGRDAWRPSLEFARLDVSGGLFLDMAIHDFDLARWLMGSEVCRVSAEGGVLLYPELQEVGDLDNSVTNLVFASGALGSVEAGRTGVYGYDIRTEVVGTEGALFIGELPGGSLLTAARQQAGDHLAPAHQQRFLDSYYEEMRHFVNCLLNDRRPSCGFQDGLASLEIAVAALESWRTRRPVMIGVTPIR